MDKSEAAAQLASHLAAYRRRSYDDLRALVGSSPATSEVTGPSGTRYQIQVEVFWDSLPAGVVRVRGAIDDRGWRVFLPVCSDFLLAPDGHFVDEGSDGVTPN